MKVTKKEILEFDAIDITDVDLPENWREFRKVCVSFNAYGVSGAVFADSAGKFYKICHRSTNLDRLV